MKIIGINGSPNDKGNTAFLLNEVLSECVARGAEVEIISAQKAILSAKTPFCISCSSPCNMSCYAGTLLEEALEKVAAADALVLGSPVYFGSVSGQLKAFWDKMRDLRAQRVLVGKPCGVVTCGFARFGGQETTIKAIHDLALVQGMNIVGDGEFALDAGHHGVCAQAPASEDQFALERAKILAARIISEISAR